MTKYQRTWFVRHAVVAVLLAVVAGVLWLQGEPVIAGFLAAAMLMSSVMALCLACGWMGE